MVEEKRAFEAEVSKLLHIVASALYTDKQIFLRELISNASDACERLRYLALTAPELTADDSEFRVVVTADAKGRSLSIADNGIGMNREDLIANLGTIARSGTVAFLEQVNEERDDSKASAGAVSQIGQFGVGFYSAFMVADKVVVTSRKAGEAQGWQWSSDGGGEFAIAEAKRDARGTTVTVHLRKKETDFLESARLREVVRTYADHIALPIVFKDGATEETLNTASALWTRPRKEITPEQYTEFYRHVGHAFDEPWLTLHARAEGKIEYTMLMFVPSTRPFDLFTPERKPRVKLYVKRVFITDDCEDLVPAYLRFVRGIVDSEDLPLNISRETLQHNPVLARIRAAMTKRVFRELEKKAEKAPDEYATFWENFGAVLKEGLYEDSGQREALFNLARFRSTTSGESLVSLSQYVARMKAEQRAIYTISGDEIESLRRSPQLEGFAARNIEVLLLTDPVDDFWVSSATEFEGKPFKSVTRGSGDLDALPLDEEAPTQKPNDDADGADDLIALVKLTLGDAVKDVRASSRLTDSAVCLVADEDQMDMHLERVLSRHQQVTSRAPRILEINTTHPLIKALGVRAKNKGAADELGDAARLLLDQAWIAEGEPLVDPAAFSHRLMAVMTKALAG
jgi:molecular chaperone HtpG